MTQFMTLNRAIKVTLAAMYGNLSGFQREEEGYRGRWLITNRGKFMDRLFEGPLLIGLKNWLCLEFAFNVECFSAK